MTGETSAASSGIAATGVDAVADRPGRGRGSDVERARAELVAALTELEDKVNIPKRIRRFREAQPTKFLEIVTGAGVAAAGIVALVVVGMVRRRS